MHPHCGITLLAPAADGRRRKLFKALNSAKIPLAKCTVLGLESFTPFFNRHDGYSTRTRLFYKELALIL